MQSYGSMHLLQNKSDMDKTEETTYLLELLFMSSKNNDALPPAAFYLLLTVTRRFMGHIWSSHPQVCNRLSTLLQLSLMSTGLWLNEEQISTMS